MWFRNAVRGAAGLALAVAVVEVTDVEHGFWVVLGTLSVLRSNALGTGSTALRAVGGTAVGFVVGSAIMIGVGGHLVLLWVLLPLAVLVSGVAPSMISFAAGQAGFTVVVIILFNIIDPTGWKVGLTRIEDVAIGCAVSVVVGLLFWPRGATAALGRALSDAFVTNSGYLADAVDRLTSHQPGRSTPDPPSGRPTRAYLRLDDAFRQFLAERGAKVVPVETVASLFTGSNRIRLAAYTLATLPAFALRPGQPELESVADRRSGAARLVRVQPPLVRGVRGDAGRPARPLDPPPAHDDTLHDVLREAFDDAQGPTPGRPAAHDAADALGRRVTRGPAAGAGRPRRVSLHIRAAGATQAVDLGNVGSQEQARTGDSSHLIAHDEQSGKVCFELRDVVEEQLLCRLVSIFTQLFVLCMSELPKHLLQIPCDALMPLSCILAEGCESCTRHPIEWP